MLKASATDEKIIEFIDQWASLLEQEDYNAAFDFTKHESAMGWTPELIREVIKAYGDSEPTQKITKLNNGLGIDGRGEIEKAIQRKTVYWFDETKGDIWYDLNIDGYVSDLTATFSIERKGDGINVILNDIHVM